MKKVIVFAGSNSSTSINKELVRYAGKLISKANVEYISLEDYAPPMFSIDLENEIGSHQKIKNLILKLNEADAFIVSTPEHNGMPPAFFKNILDWLSRTAKTILDGKDYLDGKSLLLLSTSPGKGGAKGAQELVAKLFTYAKADIVGRMSFPSFYDNFKNDEIVNSEFKEQMMNNITELESKL